MNLVPSGTGKVEQGERIHSPRVDYNDGFGHQVIPVSDSQQGVTGLL
ncbi:hypothetical protein [Marinobacter sp.]|nr:hypothetical protein [Marinobacter sp.]